MVTPEGLGATVVVVVVVAGAVLVVVVVVAVGPTCGEPPAVVVVDVFSVVGVLSEVEVPADGDTSSPPAETFASIAYSESLASITTLRLS